MPDDHEQPEEQKPGPEAKRLKFDMDWEDAAEKIAGKEKPSGGWPDSEKCDHPSFHQERIGMGIGTGDYLCTKCGKELSKEEQEIIKARKR